MLTGESKPVKKIKGDQVIAGSLNGNGAIHVIVSHSSAESYLAQVVKLVDDAQQSKSKTQLLVDIAAKWLTIIALTSGIATFLYWYLTGQPLAFAIERMVKVKATVHAAKLEDINTVFDDMKKGDISGRIVLEIAKP
jgi:Cu2+-exporting ATPase